MRRFHDKCGARDAGIVAGGGIVCPVPGAVLILPLAHGDVLQVGGQRDLRRRNRSGSSILEHLLAANPCAFCVLAGGQERKGDVRRRVDGQTGIRIDIGHIRDIGQLLAGRGGQVVLVDGERLPADGLAGDERCLRRRTRRRSHRDRLHEGLP